MTSLFKLVETSKTLSSIFDFRIDKSQKLYLSIILIIIRAILMATVGMIVLLLQVFLYFLYLQMFFTSLPGNLVKKIRMESLGYDESNKWLFNISYLMLYSAVLIFEFAYIFVNFLIVILSFVIDCLIWVLTLGKAKLLDTKLSLGDKTNISQSVGNIDILAIILTFVSIPLFILIGELIIPMDIDFISWTYTSAIILGLNTLFYMFFYNTQVKLDSESKAVEDTN